MKYGLENSDCIIQYFYKKTSISFISIIRSGEPIPSFELSKLAQENLRAQKLVEEEDPHREVLYIAQRNVEFLQLSPYYEQLE